MTRLLSNMRLLFVIGALALFFSGQDANAFDVIPPAGTLCHDIAGKNVQGFTVAIIYCVKATIMDALEGTNITGLLFKQQGGYLPAVISVFNMYKWAAITLALCLYGVRISTLGVEELLKESAILLFRIALVLYIIQSLVDPGFYHSVTGDGLYAALVDITGELIGFVSGVFANLALSCSPPTLPTGVNANEYVVWQGFDCIFGFMFGVSNTQAALTLYAGGILAILTACIFSGSLAIMILIMAITLFFQIILMLMRAIYTVILAYFTLALLMVIAPLLVPILVFHNEYTKEIFWKWVGIIIATIFEPLFIVGFLAFVVMTFNIFVSGGFATCHIPNEGGTCSFKQIMDYCGNHDFCIDWVPFIDIKHTPFSVSLPDDWSCNNSFPIIGGVINAFCNVFNSFKDNMLGPAINTVVNWTEDAFFGLMNLLLSIFKVPHVQGFALKMLFVTFISFIIIVRVLMDLLDIVPDLAKRITGAIGLGLFQIGQMPFENVVMTSVKAFGDGAQAGLTKALGGKLGKGAGVKGLGDAAKGGLGGGFGQVARTVMRTIKNN